MPGCWEVSSHIFNNNPTELQTALLCTDDPSCIAVGSVLTENHDGHKSAGLGRDGFLPTLVILGV